MKFQEEHEHHFSCGLRFCNHPKQQENVELSFYFVL